MNPLILAAALAAEVIPVNTQAPGDTPPTAEEVVALMELPPGFQATVYAAEPDVRQPVSMCLDDSGRVWVAECYSYGSYPRDGQDRIVVLEDNDSDGKHDKRTVFWGGGKQVTSAVVGYGGVWVLDLPGLYFIPDADGDLVPDGPPELKLDGFTLKAQHNMANGLQWGPDGWLYGQAWDCCRFQDTRGNARTRGVALPPARRKVRDRPARDDEPVGHRLGQGWEPFSLR